MREKGQGRRGQDGGGREDQEEQEQAQEDCECW